MPFMGFADVAPAVAVWTAAISTVRLTRALHGGRCVAVAIAGGLIATDLAVIAGSRHAADALGPQAARRSLVLLALLPGGRWTYAFHAGGTAAFGTSAASGPAFHASAILPANAAATAGPMLLCTTALPARPWLDRRGRGLAAASPACSTARLYLPARWIAGRPPGRARQRRWPAVVRATRPGRGHHPHRLLDNSAVRPFLAQLAGRAGQLYNVVPWWSGDDDRRGTRPVTVGTRCSICLARPGVEFLLWAAAVLVDAHRGGRRGHGGAAAARPACSPTSPSTSRRPACYQPVRLRPRYALFTTAICWLVLPPTKPPTLPLQVAWSLATVGTVAGPAVLIRRDRAGLVALKMLSSYLLDLKYGQSACSWPA